MRCNVEGGVSFLHVSVSSICIKRQDKSMAGIYPHVNNQFVLTLPFSKVKNNG